MLHFVYTYLHYCKEFTEENLYKNALGTIATFFNK